MQLSQDQLKPIVEKARAEGISDQQVMAGLIKRGFSVEGVDSKQFTQTYLQSPEQKTNRITNTPEKDLDKSEKRELRRMQSRESFQDIKETGSEIISGVKTRFGQAVEQSAKGISGERNPVLAGLDVAGNVVGAVTDTAGSLFKGVAKGLLTQEQEDSVSGKVQELAGGLAETEGVQSIVETYQGFDEDTKQNLRTTGDLGMAVFDILTLGGAKAAVQPLKTGLRATAEAVETGTKTAIKPIGQAVETISDIKAPEISLGKKTDLAETLSPKVTAKETRKIIQEGRVQKGADNILFGKKSDIITPEESVVRAKNTLETKIKDVDKLDEFQLADEIKRINKETSNTLKPQFETIKVNPKATDSALTKWDEMKKLQADEPEFLAFAGGKKFQERFEGFLKEVKGRVKGADGKFREKDLNDIWDVRKRYDNSVPDSVKQATDVSAPSTQLQHDMWLENRTILNDIIFDMSENLDDAGRVAFREMSDLYQVRQNLITKGNITQKGKGGLITKENILKTLLGAGAAKFFLFD